MNELLPEIIKVATPAIVTIAGLLFAYLGAKTGSFLNAKISQVNQDQIMNVIHASVQFVEQVANTNLTLKGQEKMLLAKQRAREVLAGMKIVVTDEELTMWIEAFINNLNEANKEVK